MRLPHVTDPKGLDVAIVGVPFDGGTSYRPGSRYGPREIRNQSSLIRSYNFFQKVAPFDRLNVADVGDVQAVERRHFLEKVIRPDQRRLIPDLARSVARAGAIRRAAVERYSHDRHVEAFRIGHVREAHECRRLREARRLKRGAWLVGHWQIVMADG